MKELWTKPEASFQGEYVNFPPVRCFPKPWQKPHPPVHICAGMGKSRMRALKDTVALWATDGVRWRFRRRNWPANWRR